MRYGKRLAAALLGATLLVVACGSPVQEAVGGDPSAGEGGVVRIAAASDLKFALEEVKSAMATANPGLDLQLSFGSSGTFFQQLQQGAPFDLYLSADVSYVDRLRDQGLVAADDVFPYAVGRLVVWSANSSPVDATRGLEALTDPAATRIAIANPEHAPYGKAAVAAMQSAGVYESALDRLVLGENIAQAGEFVASGNAQVGVIALSLALAPRYQQTGRYAEVPLDSFPRLNQAGAIMTRAQDPQAAHAVRDYLTGPQGVEILKRYGFYLPEG